jgi:hypothetical protein
MGNLYVKRITQIFHGETDGFQFFVRSRQKTWQTERQE